MVKNFYTPVVSNSRIYIEISVKTFNDLERGLHESPKQLVPDINIFKINNSEVLKLILKP